MHDPITILSERFAAALGAAFGPEHASTDPILAPAQNTKFGDYQANIAMSLAKKLGQKPRDVAMAIVSNLRWDDLCDKAPDIAGPGFINLTLSADYLAKLAGAFASDERLGIRKVDHPQTVVVDYSSPNVAKEMHVGHLRSTVIGDALARTLEHLGHTVIRQNHVGDWGTQFGMLIEYLLESAGGAEGQMHIADLNAFYQKAKQKFDADADFATRARKRVVALQAGDAQTNTLWRHLVNESKQHFNEAYSRLGVTLSDDDIRGESFYNDKLAAVVESLQQKKLAVESDGAVCVFVPGFAGKDGEPVPLIVRKSDGGFGYAATDLAAIRYRVGELSANRIVYVVDARQKDHFEQVFWTAQQAGWLDAAHTAEHVRFGTILGEDGTPFKTREGGTVKLAALLSEAVDRAAGIVKAKNTDLDAEAQREVARVVGIGAVKYADLSGDRVKDYVFSWDRMLAMEGNTAPYLQYAYARIRSIFRKAGEESSGMAMPELSAAVRVEHVAERALVLKLMQFGPVVKAVAASLEPHRLCTYLYELATMFSAFYENCPVLKAEDDATRRSRLVLCDLTARTLRAGLNLLGIEVLDRM